MEPIKTIEHKGYKIKIYPDNDALDPRELFNNNLGVMVCFHRRYNLGDKNHGFENPKAVEEWLIEKNCVWLPLYLYDHSGITMHYSNAQYPFNDRWDAGQVGVIFVTADAIEKEYKGHAKNDLEARKRALEVLKAEVQEYDDYLRGNVCGYVLENSDGEELNCCWGFFGDAGEKEAIEQAKGNAEYDLKRHGKQTQLPIGQ